MVKKLLQSGLLLSGMAPNILIKHVENTAPFLFKGELETTGKQRAYLEKLIYYKKHLDALKNLELDDYFYLCMAAHWATLGTFVPTEVSRQICEELWKHKNINKYIKLMAQVTIESWSWDYEQVTNRKSYNLENFQMISSHEGTWLSVAIGAYCTLMRNKIIKQAEEIAAIIIEEIKKEERLLLDFQKKRDHLNFLRASALMAHNFSVMNQAMDQWEISPETAFYKSIYKLGHKINENYSLVLAYAGQVNKEFMTLENHQHLSMRQPKCLRRSFKYLIPVGPFMDDWGMNLGSSLDLTYAEKGEIICALFDGYKKEEQAFGYARAYRGLISALPDGLKTLEMDLPYDVVYEIKKSNFSKIAQVSREEFEANYSKRLEQFICPVTNLTF